MVKFKFNLPSQQNCLRKNNLRENIFLRVFKLLQFKAKEMVKGRFDVLCPVLVPTCKHALNFVTTNNDPGIDEGFQLLSWNGNKIWSGKMERKMRSLRLLRLN